MIPHSKPYIDKEILAKVEGQVSSGHIATGGATKAFKDGLRSYFKNDEVYLSSTGTAALTLSLLAMGIGHGDEVILPTYVCHSVADAVLFVGATPVYCDVSEVWVMTEEQVTPLITSKTKAIIVVHLFGICADVKGFRKFNVPIVEDCCQSFTNNINGYEIGKYGDIAFYSFHATKCLTTGEGGAIRNNNKNYSDAVAKVVYQHSYFSKITDVQAVIGLAQLEEYDTYLTRRKEIADYYFSELPEGATKGIKSVDSMFFRFLIKTSGDFETIKASAALEGVAVRQGVDELLHQRFNVVSQEGYKNAQKLFDTTVSLPIYPALTNTEAEKVVQAIKKNLQ